MRISLDQAAKLLTHGHVVAVPTETVYGLAASIHHEEAIKHIFTLKGRPLNNPLIVHLSDANELQDYVSVTPVIEELINHFWPGPMTLVLPVSSNKIPSIARAGLSTVAFRVPKLAITRDLLKKTGPLVMPSANLSGKPSSTSADHVENDFCDLPVIDGGICEQGMESTILVDVEEKWAIARLGALASEDFFSILGYLPEIVERKEGSAPLTPGQLYRHYAPNAKLYCEEPTIPDFVDAIIGFKERHYGEIAKKRFFSLGLSTNPEEALYNLYAVLRKLDDEQIRTAWVDMDFPHQGLWLTLRERLMRACS